MGTKYSLLCPGMSPGSSLFEFCRHNKSSTAAPLPTSNDVHHDLSTDLLVRNRRYKPAADGVSVCTAAAQDLYDMDSDDSSWNVAKQRSKIVSTEPRGVGPPVVSCCKDFTGRFEPQSCDDETPNVAPSEVTTGHGEVANTDLEGRHSAEPLYSSQLSRIPDRLLTVTDDQKAIFEPRSENRGSLYHNPNPQIPLDSSSCRGASQFGSDPYYRGVLPPQLDHDAAFQHNIQFLPHIAPSSRLDQSSSLRNLHRYDPNIYLHHNPLFGRENMYRVGSSQRFDEEESRRFYQDLPPPRNPHFNPRQDVSAAGKLPDMSAFRSPRGHAIAGGARYDCASLPRGARFYGDVCHYNPIFDRDVYHYSQSDRSDPSGPAGSDGSHRDFGVYQ